MPCEPPAGDGNPEHRPASLASHALCLWTRARDSGEEFDGWLAQQRIITLSAGQEAVLTWLKSTASTQQSAKFGAESNTYENTSCGS